MDIFQAFHASKHIFETPDYELLATNRSGHENGLLGLWVAKSKEWIQGFGPHIYELEIIGECLEITVEQLRSWGRECEGNPGGWLRKRGELLSDGIDYLKVVEFGGRVDMAIVINFTSIRQFDRITSHLLAEEMSVINPVKEKLESNAIEAISRYVGASDDVETRHLDNSNPEGLPDSHFFDQESHARTGMFASLSLLSDEKIVELLQAQQARDYDGSTFQVATLAQVRAWQGAKTPAEVIAEIAALDSSESQGPAARAGFGLSTAAEPCTPTPKRHIRRPGA